MQPFNLPAHKPNVEQERFRIYDNRGEIRTTHDGVQRVFLRARMYPGYITTRSIGDLIPHQIGMTSEPHVKTESIKHTCKFIVLGSSSLYDNLPIPAIVEKITEMNIG